MLTTQILTLATAGGLQTFKQTQTNGLWVSGLEQVFTPSTTVEGDGIRETLCLGPMAEDFRRESTFSRSESFFAAL